MRVMFTTWAWPTHFFPLVPLAWAFQSAGHTVLVASQPSLLPTIRGCGLAAAVIGSDDDISAPLRTLLRQDPGDRTPRKESRTVRRYADMAGAMAGPLTTLVHRWRPDLVVFEESTYAAPLVAAAAGIPAVRHLWGVDIMSFVRWSEPISLAALAARLGVQRPDAALVATVDACPPSLQVPADYARTTMRHTPYNGAASVPAWLDAGSRRPRICVTYGRTLSQVGHAVFMIGRILTAIASLDVEVIAAVSPDDRRRLAELGELAENVRVLENQPLNTFLGGCELVVSHGGPGTVLTAAALGVPQLCIPQVADQRLLAEKTSQCGAGAAIDPEHASVERIRAVAAGLLADGRARDAADRLRAENRALSPPASVVAELASLA